MRIIPLLLVAGLVSGCIRTSTDPVTGSVDLDVESPTKQGEDWQARLTSTTMPGLQGTATARVYAGETQVSITMNGVTSGAAHPWHVHRGGCGSGGEIVGTASAYPTISAGNDGRATGSARLTMQLDEAQTYHVDVHASSYDMGTVIACGNLSD
jgi:hypothetical protein